ncbi:hypothetical protein NL317_31785, partial [Klebsiella pneumoniae]|nr:hypothetical protein [Klebsiella pneumoniae]
QVFQLGEADVTVVRRLARDQTLALAGPGATAELAAEWGALHLPGDPVSAALSLVDRAREIPAARPS